MCTGRCAAVSAAVGAAVSAVVSDAGGAVVSTAGGAVDGAAVSAAVSAVVSAAGGAVVSIAVSAVVDAAIGITDGAAPRAVCYVAGSITVVARSIAHNIIGNIIDGITRIFQKGIISVGGIIAFCDGIVKCAVGVYGTIAHPSIVTGTVKTGVAAVGTCVCARAIVIIIIVNCGTGFIRSIVSGHIAGIIVFFTHSTACGHTYEGQHQAQCKDFFCSCQSHIFFHNLLRSMILS